MVTRFCLNHSGTTFLHVLCALDAGGKVFQKVRRSSLAHICCKESPHRRSLCWELTGSLLTCVKQHLSMQSLSNIMLARMIRLSHAYLHAFCSHYAATLCCNCSCIA